MKKEEACRRIDNLDYYLQHYTPPDYSECDHEAMMMAKNALEQEKIGRWIREKSIHGWDGYSYQCSECGRSIHLDTVVESLIDYPYCHCGSRNMR